MKKNELIKLLEATKEALETLKASYAALKAKFAKEEEADGRTLGEWLDVHAQQIREHGYKPQTISNRMGSIKHIRRLWGDRPLRALKAHEIATALRSAFLPKKTSTAQRVLSELRQAYTAAIANDWCDVSPAVHVAMPKHRVKRKRLSLDTWQRVRRWAKALPRWVEAMLLLGIVTGQRRSDLAKMRFDDVVDGHLQVVQHKKAGKVVGAHVAIPLDLRIDAIGMSVGGVIEYCRSIGKPGEYLLRTKGGCRIEVSSLSARFAEAIRGVLGKDAHAEHEWPSLHEVRSLSARTYVEQGMDPAVVQVLLGHSNIEMTQLYMDDRGLTARKFKRVALSGAASLPSANDPAPELLCA